MTSDGFLIRLMDREDVDFAVDLAAGEGWNPGRSDAECFYRADPDGFFIAELEGEAVGCISAVAYPEDFGFVGLYIVVPDYRGRGYGLRLWNQAMARLKGMNVGLDGVVAQQANYAKSGFRLAYRNVRYQGTGGGVRPANAVPLNDIPFAAVEAYDRLCFPSRRTGFLKSWLGQDGGIGYALQKGSDLAGWGFMRPCGIGWKVGPLFADTPSGAALLYQALASHAPNHPVFLDVPEPHHAAVSLAEERGMTVVFETARMYTGQDPDFDLHKVFGVTTFELG